MGIKGNLYLKKEKNMEKQIFSKNMKLKHN